MKTCDMARAIVRIIFSLSKWSSFHFLNVLNPFPIFLQHSLLPHKYVVKINNLMNRHMEGIFKLSEKRDQMIMIIV